MILNCLIRKLGEMMTGRLLKRFVLAFFLMVAINQISPLVLINDFIQNRGKGRTICKNKMILKNDFRKLG